jgi:hypothetical protein
MTRMIELARASEATKQVKPSVNQFDGVKKTESPCVLPQQRRYGIFTSTSGTTCDAA